MLTFLSQSSLWLVLAVWSILHLRQVTPATSGTSRRATRRLAWQGIGGLLDILGVVQWHLGEHFLDGCLCGQVAIVIWLAFSSYASAVFFCTALCVALLEYFDHVRTGHL